MLPLWVGRVRFLLILLKIEVPPGTRARTPHTLERRAVCCCAPARLALAHATRLPVRLPLRLHGLQGAVPWWQCPPGPHPSSGSGRPVRHCVAPNTPPCLRLVFTVPRVTEILYCEHHGVNFKIWASPPPPEPSAQSFLVEPAGKR